MPDGDFQDLLIDGFGHSVSPSLLETQKQGQESSLSGFSTAGF